MYIYIYIYIYITLNRWMISANKRNNNYLLWPQPKRNDRCVCVSVCVCVCVCVNEQKFVSLCLFPLMNSCRREVRWLNGGYVKQVNSRCLLNAKHCHDYADFCPKLEMRHGSCNTFQASTPPRPSATSCTTVLSRRPTQQNFRQKLLLTGTHPQVHR